MSKIFLAIAIITVIALIGGTLYWYFVLSKEPTPIDTSTTPTPAKNGAATLGELVLCKDFQKTEGEIACEDALNIAKARYAGKITRIVRANNLRPKTSEPTPNKGIDSWLIYMLLDKPIQQEGRTGDNVAIVIARKTGEVVIPARLLK